MTSCCPSKMLLSSSLPQKLTEQRLPVFSHEIVPDYLRTKPDPEVEEQEKQLSAEAARIGVEVAQVSVLLVPLSLLNWLEVFSFGHGDLHPDLASHTKSLHIMSAHLNASQQFPRFISRFTFQLSDHSAAPLAMGCPTSPGRHKEGLECFCV